ncbi:hypothetical protein SKAU_G00231060 [Synaphobranchus kaupii]|uniref:Integrase catalytic domain-containing protein n=1 Tax=Synaphobranchus kaupii TaxID=118154 RepID=A0A9Q1F5V8_SYNKA|nr:hypothetical protein SKAU_G00231060 [Synaphobranchus kaupii]
MSFNKMLMDYELLKHEQATYSGKDTDHCYATMEVSLASIKREPSDSAPATMEVSLASIKREPSDSAPATMEVSLASIKREPSDSAPDTPAKHQAVGKMDQFQWFQHINWFLQRGFCQQSLTKKIRASIVRASKNYLIEDGRLFYTGEDMPKPVVMTPEERETVLQECHDYWGHHAKRSTADKVCHNYYWKTRSHDTEEWVKSCPNCLQNKPKKLVGRDRHPIVVQKPWSVLGMDLIGPLPTTPRGHVYVLTMTDLFTKWVIAEPLKTNTAAEVASKLTFYLKLFGLVDKIITDQGSEFVNELNNDLCEILHMKHSISSTSRQTNDQGERTNRNINNILKKYINEKQNDWDNYVTDAVFAINTSKQASTKHTPYLAMFNRHPKMPTALSWNPLDDDFVIGSVEDGIDERIQEAEKMFENIRQNIDKTQKKRKKDNMSQETVQRKR